MTHCASRRNTYVPALGCKRADRRRDGDDVLVVHQVERLGGDVGRVAVRHDKAGFGKVEEFHRFGNEPADHRKVHAPLAGEVTGTHGVHAATQRVDLAPHRRTADDRGHRDVDGATELEQRVVEMTHAAVENQAIIDNLQSLTRALLTVKNAADLPEVLVEKIRRQFMVPMVCLKLWGQGDETDNTDKLVLDEMKGLYCGFAENAPTLKVFEAEEIAPRSVVVIPLRVGVSPQTFGCLGFGSPDKDRFSPTLETDFLHTLAETACAALSRIQAIQP